ncbi:carboxylesterase [Diaporthe helianthi]|uniref:Carboxylic ester hydrolase n=1 Tax=Diaporthe helianthi TaxID=158607 RepID=A0A2P5I6P5_DIAHE|nr:carboxylesterase [Diaporthe helianthi]
MTTSFLALLALTASSSWASSISTNSLVRHDIKATDPATTGPIVDLGYAFHTPQLTTSPDERTYYNFSNIRYAAPPVGSLRFQLPRDPIDNRSAGVQDGTYGKICPQAYTPWQNPSFVTAPPGELESEDCLFLDVVVPESAWHQRFNSSRPVMVWIHGGGFQIGAKWGGPLTNPLGLQDRSFDEDGEGVVFVALNYRLGALGWLQGESFTSAGGVPNVGLHDQRKALEWIQQKIHLFGGDPSRITIMGESAGGGSILHHITAYGGEKGAPQFQRAILQSPAYVPRPYVSQAENSFSIFLEAANASTLSDLVALDTHNVQIANKLSQSSNFFGSFQFGPAPDGDYVPDLPEKLLASGRFHKGVQVMVAHNTFEAQKYTDPTATNSSVFETWMKLYFPDIPAAALEELTTEVYPPVYNDTSVPWTTPLDRLMTAVADITFTCHACFVASAVGSGPGVNGSAVAPAYSYLFSVPPGIHTLDVNYSFYVNSTWSPLVTNATTAGILQGYLTTFAETGDPNREGLPAFPVYGGENMDLNLNATFVDVIRDPAANSRCDWWREASYA